MPKNWEKTYYEWMRNIQPWCISRQLWWGHQIPAWYGPDGTVFVEETENLALRAAARHYGTRVMLTRDEDVLDTWFSSALWPFSTLGWPEETPELKRHYKTDVLVTGFDIIFFWVARMMMMGLHFMKEVPFHTVYIHALVRDEKGQKMSKSKGNVIDPLELIDAYGADALRFTLAAMAAQGRDIKLAKPRVEGYRNFGTKLWNAARFAEMNGVAHDPNYDPLAARVTVNRWIAGETARTEARGAAGARRIQVQRGGGCALPVRLERVLRLVSRTDQADPHRHGRGGQGRDARHHGLGDGPDPAAAASLHALRDGRTVAADGHAQAMADRVRLARLQGPGRCRRPMPRWNG